MPIDGQKSPSPTTGAPAIVPFESVPALRLPDPDILPEIHAVLVRLYPHDNGRRPDGLNPLTREDAAHAIMRRLCAQGRLSYHQIIELVQRLKNAELAPRAAEPARRCA